MDKKIQELKEWVQHRIDYLEGVCDKDDEDDLLSQGQSEGELFAYHRMQQHINTTFGEWVKSE